MQLDSRTIRGPRRDAIERRRKVVGMATSLKIDQVTIDLFELVAINQYPFYLFSSDLRNF